MNELRMTLVEEGHFSVLNITHLSYTSNTLEEKSYNFNIYTASSVASSVLTWE